MKSSQKTEAIKMAAQTMLAFGVADKARVMALVAGCAELSLDDFRQGCRHCVKFSKHPPRPWDIYHALGRTPEQLAEEDWLEAVSLLRHGRRRSYDFGPLANIAMRRLAGINRWCNSENDFQRKALREDFLSVHQTLQRTQVKLEEGKALTGPDSSEPILAARVDAGQRLLPKPRAVPQVPADGLESVRTILDRLDQRDTAKASNSDGEQ